MSNKADKIYEKIKAGFQTIVNDADLKSEEVKITSKGLTPEEAIGNTKRKDYPILTGEEVLLQAAYMGALGQAFTDAPATFKGTLEEVMAMDITEDLHARGLYLASMNAVMRYLGLLNSTVHCRMEEPEECAHEFVKQLKCEYPSAKIALVGYQPSLFEELSKEFALRVLDLNPKNVGEERFGIKVEHGIDDYEEVVLKWADLVLCTGSVFCNGTMHKYVDIDKDVIFFGTSGSGAAYILGLKRLCPMAK
jgi:uncharacterized protein (DUF4213/DUF364 family)